MTRVLSTTVNLRYLSRTRVHELCLKSRDELNRYLFQRQLIRTEVQMGRSKNKRIYCTKILENGPNEHDDTYVERCQMDVERFF